MDSLLRKRRKNYFIPFVLTALFSVFVLIALLNTAVVLDGVRNKPPNTEDAQAETIKPADIPDDELIHPTGASIPYTEDDVELLARIMMAERGPSWPILMTMALGEVVLNRVLSPEFPNTIEEVIYQSNPIQYEPVYSDGWDSIIITPDVKDAARRLLSGERVIGNPAVVFQALFEQGDKTVLSYYDFECDSTTYWCTSYHPELYI